MLEAVTEATAMGSAEGVAIVMATAIVDLSRFISRPRSWHCKKLDISKVGEKKSNFGKPFFAVKALVTCVRAPDQLSGLLVPMPLR